MANRLTRWQGGPRWTGSHSAGLQGFASFPRVFQKVRLPIGGNIPQDVNKAREATDLDSHCL